MMADLLDIAPSTTAAVVTVGDIRITVRGISIDAIASIVARYPGLKSLASGGFGEDIYLRLIEGFGPAVASIIAAGCGHLGDAEYEQCAARLLPDYQLDFLTAIAELSFPNGIGSFVVRLTSLMNKAGGGAKPVIKVRLKSSQSTSPISSAAASHSTMQ
jgi:hypothetical protein